MNVRSDADHYIFNAHVDLGDLSSEIVDVELYANGVNGSDPIRHHLTQGERVPGALHVDTYTARVAATRSASDYTVRVITKCPGLAILLEAGWILWQR